jgi:hypothetical protein
VPGDHRAAQRGDQRIALLIERVGFEGGHQEVVRELVLRVDDDRLDGAAVEGALPDVLHVFAALADVDRQGHHVFAGRIVQPADADRGVESARVGEDDAFCHEGCLLGSVFSLEFGVRRPERATGRRAGQRCGAPIGPRY